VHVETGKIYIGQSKNIAHRISCHQAPSNECKYLCNAIQKHGWNAFNVFLLESVDDLSKLTEREQFWLDYFESYKEENGYNICSKAESSIGVKPSAETRAKIGLVHKGKPRSEETKIKISMAHKGKIHSEEHRNKNSMAHKGKVNSEESKIKMSLARKGKHRSEETINKISTANHKKVLQLDAKTKTLICAWPSLVEAGKSLGIGDTHISSCCHGKRKTAGGFAWQFAPTGEQSCLIQ
jgi:group I intron endonuclease